MKRTFMLIMLTFFLFMHSYVLAGSFKVIPIKLYFDAKTKTAVLKIINEGEEKVTVQLDAKKWSQDATGADVFENTKDIIFFPKISDIEKGQEKILRIGYQGQKSDEKEKTYRLFVQELPVSKPGEMMLKLALRFGIPIFVKPEKVVAKWTTEIVGLSEESLRVKIKNEGNSHLIASKIRETGLDEAGKETFSREISGWYALAGATRLYTIDVSQEECLKTSSIKVDIVTEKESREAGLNIEKSMCTKKPEKPLERKKE